MKTKHHSKDLTKQKAITSTHATHVYVWGSDYAGQLGLGGNKRTSVSQQQQKPQEVADSKLVTPTSTASCIYYALPKLCSYNLVITQIACAREHAVFLTNHGYLYSVGSNTHGQLGLGDDHYDHSKYSSNINSLHANSSPSLIQALAKEKCMFVSCGNLHTVAITRQGQPYAWGHNSHGQLGTGDQIHRFTPTRMQITFQQEEEEVLRGDRQTDQSEVVVKFINSSCGSNHTLLVSSTHEVYVCGSNQHGQLGLRDSIISSNSNHIANDNINKSSKNQSYATAVQLFPQNLRLKHKIVQTACGNAHSLVLDSSGRVYSAGSNEHYELGRVVVRKQQQLQQQQQRYRDEHTYDLLSQQRNQENQQNWDCSFKLVDYNNNTLGSPQFTMIAACQYQSLAVSQEGKVCIWGMTKLSSYSHPVQLQPKQSNEPSKSKQSLAIPVFKSASLGEDYGVCVDNLGGVWTWGDNSLGQLAQGLQQQENQLSQGQFSISPVFVKALKSRPVEAVSCGAGFVWALGKKIKESIERDKLSEHPASSNLDKSQPLSIRQTKSRSNSNKPQSKIQSTPKKHIKGQGQQSDITSSSNSRSRSKGNRKRIAELPIKEQIQQQDQISLLRKQKEQQQQYSLTTTSQMPTADHNKNKGSQQQYYSQPSYIRQHNFNQQTKYPHDPSSFPSPSSTTHHQDASPTQQQQHIYTKPTISESIADRYNERESMRIERERMRIEREVFSKDKQLLAKQVDMLIKDKRIMEQQITFWKGQQQQQKNISNLRSDSIIKSNSSSNEQQYYYLRFMESQEVITALETQLAEQSSADRARIQDIQEQLRILRVQTLRDIQALQSQLAAKDQWINKLSQDLKELIGNKEREQQYKTEYNEDRRYSKNYSSSNDNRFNTHEDMNQPTLPPENTFVSQTLPSFANNNIINTNTTDTIPDIHHHYHPTAVNNYLAQHTAPTWSDNSKNLTNIPNHYRQSLQGSTGKQYRETNANQIDYDQFDENNIGQSLVDSHIFSLSQQAGGSQAKNNTAQPPSFQTQNSRDNSKNSSFILMSTQKRLFSEGNNNHRNSPFSQSLHESAALPTRKDSEQHNYAQRQLQQQYQSLSNSAANRDEQSQLNAAQKNTPQSPFAINHNVHFHSRFNSEVKTRPDQIQVEKLRSASAKKLFHLLEETNSSSKKNVSHSLCKSAVLGASQTPMNPYDNSFLKLDNSNSIAQFVVSQRCSAGERSRTSASFELTDVKKRLADMRRTTDSLLFSDMKSFDRKVNLAGY